LKEFSASRFAPAFAGYGKKSGDEPIHYKQPVASIVDA
jgi:hypothetical protein